MKMTMRTTSTFKEHTAFIGTYAAALLGCGATCVRLEKNIGRIASAYGIEVEMTIMPRHIHLFMRDKSSGTSESAVIEPRKMPISFRCNTLLSRLSWEIADGQIEFSGAGAALQRAVSQPPRSKELVTFMVCCASASFCRLFGGDLAAMGVLMLSTCAGFMLRCHLLERKVDIRAVMFLCALVSSVLGATDMLFSIGSTPEIALGTSVLYLVPGIPFLNAFSDVINRHYICAFSRFMDAVVLTCCLSAGLCTGLLVMNAGMFR